MVKEKVKLILIVDASSSMIMTTQETVDAVEGVIEQHRALKDKKVRVQIYSFGAEVNEIVPTMKLKDYDKEFTKVYNPYGMTALYDAIGAAVTTNMEDASFSKTSLIVMTDGEENASQKFGKESVAKLLTKVQDELGWDVSYIGANIANFNEKSMQLGFKLSKSIAIDPSKSGTRGMSLQTASAMSMSYMNSQG